MDWSEQVFNYCERGLDPAFWAEPLNAVTNGAFLIGMWAAGRRLVRVSSGSPRGAELALWMLTVLVGVIGTGSFLFHTLATRWSLVADVLPIMLFMLGYLAFALRVFVGAPWLAIGAALVAFYFAGGALSGLKCQSEGLSVPCLNGSLGYGPAAVTLIAVAILARQREPGASRLLSIGAGLFLVSLMFRTLDMSLCAATSIGGSARGTHFIWHSLNAVLLYLLLVAGIGVLERRRDQTLRT